MSTKGRVLRAMRRARLHARSFLAVLLGIAACVPGRHIGWAAERGGDVIADISAAQAGAHGVNFLPGAFRLDDRSARVTTLCLPFRGRWVSPGDPPAPCPTDPATARPPAALTYDMAIRDAGQPQLVVGNLGIDARQWSALTHGEGAESGPGAALVHAVHLDTRGDAVVWGLQSANLPPELKAEVPGSGLYFHFGDIYPIQSMPYLFTGSAGELVIEAKVGYQALQVSGQAATTLTIAMDLQMPDANGTRVDVPLVMTLYNSRVEPRDNIGSDGRTAFVSTALPGRSRFVEALAAPRSDGPPQAGSEYRLAITCAKVSNLLGTFNASRTQHGLPPLDTSCDKVRLRSAQIRSESRFLDKGDVNLSLAIGELRLVRRSG
jgi:hypothetical protein